MAFHYLPNEVIVQIFHFLSIGFLANQISTVSHRFSEISNLVLFPSNSNSNNNEKVKRRKKEFNFSKNHFYIEGNVCRIPIPIPEVPPPTNWKLGVSKFFIEYVDDYGQSEGFLRLRQFIQFLADSGQIEHCKIDLGDCCTDLKKFTFDEGYFSPMRGKVLEWTINHFTVDDHVYESYHSPWNLNNAPFSHPFLLEIPQLILHLDNLVDCEREKSLGDDMCTRFDFDVAEWLGTPLPQNSPYPSRKVFMRSERVENVTGLVGLIALNYLRSTRPCPFDVFIHYLGDGNLENFLPSQPNIHSITGEILQIRPYNPTNDTDGKQRKFVVRRCMIDKIAIEPTFYSTEKSCLFEFY